jgi:tRNA nucleotidyltransferase/poly(A) polymerase
MKLKEILSTIDTIAKDNGFSTPYLCGGLVRDKYRGDLSDINDIDITTGDKSVFLLADEVSNYFKKSFNITTTTATDGHKSVQFANIKMDFSSNYNHPDIENKLKDLNVNPTNLLKEMYSRDFTCNAFLSDMNFHKIFDPTNKGSESVKTKMLLPPIDAETTFHDDKRIIRAIYLCAKLDYNLNDDCIEFLRQSPIVIDQASYLKKKIDQCLELNLEKTIDTINKTNLWEKIPITTTLYPFYKSRDK